MSTITKVCPSCKEEKTLTEFGLDKSRLDGLRYHCKVCNNQKSTLWQKQNKEHKAKYQREWNKKNPDKQRKSHIKSLYGLGWEVYQQMYIGQEGLCKICGVSLPLFNEQSGGKRLTIAVDHCHTTGKVRGLLCSCCNKGLGLFKDNPGLLRKACNYLEEFTIDK